ncbi:MAG: tRNA (N(6)-L-threonylcarbamoyladenosine(37)-C(2))-methylthiotransferase MtaB [Dorea sp.]|nr:tRNA (N(6)-L-threonylcarbamoyladenosine(37)-C(2))-methylthiotransferase MtaB [Dorea sp.]
MKKAAFHNLGCKVNAYETEAMQQLFEENGFETVPFSGKADVYVVNTCTVTNMADRKSRQMLHRARKNNPDAVVIAAGCYVQEKEGHVDSCIDIIVGNNRKKDIIEILREYEKEHRGSRAFGSGDFYDGRIDISHAGEYEELRLGKTAEHTRAYIKVQDGCNQFCSYCIIPFARGRVRSRRPESVLDEVRTLAGKGYKEIVLTGIHLSSYGADFKEEGETLLPLIEKVHGVDGIERIRLGSLEPGIITEEFAERLSSLRKVCPHFHLSLQSGCNATLKRMNRRYTKEEYYEKCVLLRKYFDNPALTTDVIVGFPGETQEEFEESRAFIDQADFYETHIFKYSRREGTKAAGMPGQVPEEEKARRSAILLEMSRKKENAYERMLIGTSRKVLVEEESIMDGETYQVGHTMEYVKIRQKSEKNQINQIINVEIESHLQIIH